MMDNGGIHRTLIYADLIVCQGDIILQILHSLLHAANPNPAVTEIAFIPSTKPKNNDPPEVILSFNVSVAPPTYVTCQVDSTPVDVAVLSREVTAGEYLPPNTASPVTNVNVTLRTRQAGNYQCTVSVFRANGDNLTNATTSPINISGKIYSNIDIITIS